MNVLSKEEVEEYAQLKKEKQERIEQDARDAAWAEKDGPRRRALAKFGPALALAIACKRATREETWSERNIKYNLEGDRQLVEAALAEIGEAEMPL